MLHLKFSTITNIGDNMQLLVLFFFFLCVRGNPQNLIIYSDGQGGFGKNMDREPTFSKVVKWVIGNEDGGRSCCRTMLKCFHKWH